ncbi:unnamed protein product [Acanthoscelides obtectus]|uniref:Uncharacterized protein n=1 Tax=Acanthoscelides obtectus TaxID=200917 RepID=A0A9P0KKM4_ACAOB|nr:unnamed protein product [Acanthoscelides obtectus]CAK1670278.1 Probable RNA-directed DNA polymerase from transposon BS [Acanthoscelides obtectus]
MPSCFLESSHIPQHASAKYLGFHMDDKINWKQHLSKKRKQIDLKSKELNWLIGRKSKLSIENKLLIYKAIIKPIWTYGIELWGCASKPNLSIIQRAQSKILRSIADDRDLKIPFIREVIVERSCKHHGRLSDHPNPLLPSLLDPTETRRLKRKLPLDLQD